MRIHPSEWTRRISTSLQSLGAIFRRLADNLNRLDFWIWFRSGPSCKWIERKHQMISNDELLGYYMFSINKDIIFWVPPTQFLWTWASCALTSASQRWVRAAGLANYNAGMAIPAEIWLLSSIPDLPVLGYRVAIGLLARNARVCSCFPSHFLACHLFRIMFVEVPRFLELCSFTTILVLG